MITYLIIALTCLVSIPAFQNRAMFSKLLFNPSIVRTNKEWYRFITHALLHADFIHLAMNMYVLYMFGGMVEERFISSFEPVRGETYFFLLYFTSVIASTIPSYEKHKNDYHYNAVGASGAVSAIVFSAILLNPWMDLALLFIPVPIPAPVFGILYLVYCWYMAKRGGDNIAHDVHYWGSLFGVVFTLAILPQTFFNLIEAIKDIF
ncbi:MAG: rhomboid family intramembrane serine protease [Bacteroidetes bacterium]|nr:MAG: rhomboid family intramembrane serine protease [Bacteroidota bacterium]